MDDWSDQAENGDDDLRAQRDTPSSMHPVGSIATTTVTRAPNTISVGYMAGINARPLPAIPEDRTTIDFVHSVASDVSADTRHYMPDDISGDEILPSIPAIPPSSTSLTPAQQELHHHISIATEISQSQTDRVPITLELDVYFATPNKHNWTTRVARLDTLADGNFISETLVEFLDYHVQPYTGALYRAATGEIKPSGEVSIYFQVFEIYQVNENLFVLALAPMSSEEKQLIRNSAAEQQRQRVEHERREQQKTREKRDAERQELQRKRQAQEHRGEA
ncbi:hypothetical protein MMC28_010711 [Mycoblastus sanguinarius]|nr:hypothetical protein [Mycoblastus sanguinarius]